MSDFDNERYRLQQASKLPTRLPTPGEPVMVGKVVTAAPVVGTFLEVNPVSVTGNEVEGTAGVTEADTSVSVPVYLVGPGVPQTGDLLVCRFVDYRWVAERRGPHKTPNPCHCTWPSVVSYRGSVTQCQGAFYFVNQTVTQPEPTPYTLTYGPRPADIPKQLRLLYYSYPGGVRDPYYITMPDAAWFSAPIPGYIFGIPTNIYFYIWFQACRANAMVIDAPYGNAYLPDGSRGAGNNVITYVQKTCSPFAFVSDFTPGRPADITGTHGSDDIVPDANGGAGYFTNSRIGL